MYAKNGSVKDRREMLKVKFNSLMAEARIIRNAERKTHGILREDLRHHRRTVVRYEARLTSIALGLINGKKYEQIECCSSKPDWDRVNSMLMKYGGAVWIDLVRKGEPPRDKPTFIRRVINAVVA